MAAEGGGAVREAVMQHLALLGTADGAAAGEAAVVAALRRVWVAPSPRELPRQCARYLVHHALFEGLQAALCVHRAGGGASEAPVVPACGLVRGSSLFLPVPLYARLAAALGMADLFVQEILGQTAAVDGAAGDGDAGSAADWCLGPVLSALEEDGSHCAPPFVHLLVSLVHLARVGTPAAVLTPVLGLLQRSQPLVARPADRFALVSALSTFATAGIATPEVMRDGGDLGAASLQALGLSPDTCSIVQRTVPALSGGPEGAGCSAPSPPPSHSLVDSGLRAHALGVLDGMLGAWYDATAWHPLHVALLRAASLAAPSASAPWLAQYAASHTETPTAAEEEDKADDQTSPALPEEPAPRRPRLPATRSTRGYCDALHRLAALRASEEFDPPLVAELKASLQTMSLEARAVVHACAQTLQLELFQARSTDVGALVREAAWRMRPSIFFPSKGCEAESQQLAGCLRRLVSSAKPLPPDLHWHALVAPEQCLSLLLREAAVNPSLHATLRRALSALPNLAALTHGDSGARGPTLLTRCVAALLFDGPQALTSEVEAGRLLTFLQSQQHLLPGVELFQHCVHPYFAVPPVGGRGTDGALQARALELLQLLIQGAAGPITERPWLAGPFLHKLVAASTQRGPCVDAIRAYLEAAARVVAAGGAKEEKIAILAELIRDLPRHWEAMLYLRPLVLSTGVQQAIPERLVQFCGLGQQRAWRSVPSRATPSLSDRQQDLFCLVDLFTACRASHAVMQGLTCGAMHVLEADPAARFRLYALALALVLAGSSDLEQRMAMQTALALGERQAFVADLQKVLALPKGLALTLAGVRVVTSVLLVQRALAVLQQMPAQLLTRGGRSAVMERVSRCLAEVVVHPAATAACAPNHRASGADLALLVHLYHCCCLTYRLLPKKGKESAFVPVLAILERCLSVVPPARSPESAALPWRAYLGLLAQASNVVTGQAHRRTLALKLTSIAT